ncbi:MAG TPA: ATP-binding cassette domain-containing protein [Candidatus Saccharibacteria bacterium]|nr:ATP-binding cassette domain-containing protein [Candidatus Saccharibacteria bacterium]HMT56109.1 ATP-binding cassette domain-containing protein [Candidatus Saccharibacteria bacterium]
MEQKLFNEINASIMNGLTIDLVVADLVAKGWPADISKKAVDDWIRKHAVVRHDEKTSLKRWLSKYYFIARPAIATVVILSLIDTAIALLKPWPVKIMADSVFGRIPAWGPLENLTGTTTLLMITSIASVSLFVVGAIFGAFRDYFLLKISFRLNRSIKEESLTHILHLPLFHQQRLAKGDYVYRQNVVTNSLSDLVLGTTAAIIQSILIIVGVLIIMLSINVNLSLISIILLPLLFITIKIIGPKMGFYARKYTENASETSAKISESVDNAEAVQAFTLEKKLVSHINQLWINSYIFTRKNQLWGELLTGVNGLLVASATALVMYIGGSAAMKSNMTFGDLLIFMTYMGYLIGPVETLIHQITTRNQKLIDVSRIYEVMTDHEGVEYLRQENHMPKVIGKIEFKNITYSYNDRTVLSNLNFTINPGQKIAIIGPSGSGKSTILKLLPLFIEPSQGEVLIDGINTQHVSLRELRKNIAWVSQNPQLFNDTILENLLEGDVDRYVGDQEIADAVEVSNISEFVLDMPLAFDTPVGENGGSLSGGQKQRISIARALVKNAPIICLDEPTAALDIKSENYIRDSLEKMIQGKTVVMVTHRKPLLALMDEVYVLTDGNLVHVNNFGGLDTYLAKLEGIEQKKATEEIKIEKSNKDNDIALMNRLKSYFVEMQRKRHETLLNAQAMAKARNELQSIDHTKITMNSESEGLIEIKHE